MRVCQKCQKNKEESSFYSHTQINGITYIRSECKECTKEKHKKYRQENKLKRNELSRDRSRQNKEVLVEKFGGKCLDCGGIFPACVYDFHHLDPSTKEKQIAPWLSKKNDYYTEELKKCVMLCSNCHRIRHFVK